MASVRYGRWRVRRVGGGNNPDEASVLDKNRTRVRRDERASSTGVWFGGGWAKSWGEEVRQIILRNWQHGPRKP
jgi:hypothetical protein